ncbi:MAG: ABC transporter permease [Deltaproteobacteria bacterium]|nr:ABC transporter permease [Deltaproteobacteria bacterium]
MNSLQLLGALELGLIYALVALGVYITFRIVDFADLTVDGSFPLGAAVAATLLVKGYHPVLATLCATAAGSLAGSLTAYLHTQWNILALLSGILVMISMYSINLRIMDRPNITLLNETTLFNNTSVVWFLALIVSLVLIGLTRFFSSEFGLAMRGAGENAQASAAFGISVAKMKLVALALSNALVALAGSLFAQSQSFADISMGNGTVIGGLAAVIVGETLLRPKHIAGRLLVCIVGSIVYRLAVVFALNIPDIGLRASDLNLITASLVAVTLLLAKRRKKGLS